LKSLYKIPFFILFLFLCLTNDCREVINSSWYDNNPLFFIWPHCHLTLYGKFFCENSFASFGVTLDREQLPRQVDGSKRLALYALFCSCNSWSKMMNLNQLRLAWRYFFDLVYYNKFAHEIPSSVSWCNSVSTSWFW